MNPGDVVLISIPQFAGGPGKLRPALLLSILPGAFQSMLICGISSRVDQLVNEWDERIRPADVDFAGSGLHRESSIRLSYLYSADAAEVRGTIGSIDPVRHAKLLKRLADHLQP
jgi:hypothetical protein